MRRSVVAASLAPQAAFAECLGQGCYDGLAVLIGLLILAALIVAALVITLVVLLVRKRWTAAKIVAAVLGVIGLIAFALMV